MTSLHAAVPARRHDGGYRLLYHPGEISRCPCCGQRQWIIGRLMAECAHCEAALPLDQVHGVGSVARFVNSRPPEPFFSDPDGYSEPATA
mgnify:CR=1 FL=1|jgi:hypothetical protein